VHVAVVRRVAGSRDLVGTASEFLEVLVERELTPRFLSIISEEYSLLLCLMNFLLYESAACWYCNWKATVVMVHNQSPTMMCRQVERLMIWVVIVSDWGHNHLVRPFPRREEEAFHDVTACRTRGGDQWHRGVGCCPAAAGGDGVGGVGGGVGDESAAAQ